MPRGKVVCEVIVQETEAAGAAAEAGACSGRGISARPTAEGPSLRVHGVLSNGHRLEYDYECGGAVSPHETPHETLHEAPSDSTDPLGTLRSDGWWVKGRVGQGKLLLCRGRGYSVENCIVQQPASTK